MLGGYSQGNGGHLSAAFRLLTNGSRDSRLQRRRRGLHRLRKCRRRPCTGAPERRQDRPGGSDRGHRGRLHRRPPHRRRHPRHHLLRPDRWGEGAVLRQRRRARRLRAARRQHRARRVRRDEQQPGPDAGQLDRGSRLRLRQPRPQRGEPWRLRARLRGRPPARRQDHHRRLHLTRQRHRLQPDQRERGHPTRASRATARSR